MFTRVMRLGIARRNLPRKLLKVRKMNEILRCRNCIQWENTSQWKGKCKLHPWPKSKWSEDASPNGCPNYVDKATLQEVK